jgi:redox-regulated HSP33 family molecular chaperone
VTELLGEMTAAAVLMQANIKFNGALVLQIMGDGPVKLAVAEVQPDLGLRATATVEGRGGRRRAAVHMVNVNNQGRCAITLDPKDRLPGQQPYQGVVPLFTATGGEKLEKLSEVLSTTCCRASSSTPAGAGGQRHGRRPADPAPAAAGRGQPVGQSRSAATDQIGRNEDYNRIAILASSLKREELLTLDADTILHRLFWEEPVLRFDPKRATPAPLCLHLFARAGGQHAAQRWARRGGVGPGRAGRGGGGLRLLRRAVPLRPGGRGAACSCRPATSRPAAACVSSGAVGAASLPGQQRLEQPVLAVGVAAAARAAAACRWPGAPPGCRERTVGHPGQVQAHQQGQVCTRRWAAMASGHRLRSSKYSSL